MGGGVDGVEIDGLAEDDVLLITGPPMTGKYALFLDLLARHADPVVVISTRNRASKIRADLQSVAGDLPDERIGVIDCVSSDDGDPAGALTRQSGSPGNLTGIGVGFTEVFNALYEPFEDGHHGVGVHSASQLVMHAAEFRKVYKFMQVLTGQIRSAGCLGVVVVDDDAGEDVDMLRHHFDGLVETRAPDAGGREFRVHGLRPTASDWTPF